MQTILTTKSQARHNPTAKIGAVGVKKASRQN
jgi:hypothetical protein